MLDYLNATTAYNPTRLGVGGSSFFRKFYTFFQKPLDNTPKICYSIIKNQSY